MKARFFAGAAVLTGAMMAVPAMAQGADSAVDSAGDIIVTAQRREQSLQATPLAVTAITAESLRSRNINSLADLSNGAVPGINIAPHAGNPSVLVINARGIGPADPSQATQELAVPVYIDGIPLGRAQGLGLELIDPVRIEFLRGPQGQLFGRNAEGGAIQFVSRRPSGELHLDLSGQIGNYGQDRERFSMDLPEVAGIRLQASLLHSYHDGFTKNGPKGFYSEQQDNGINNSFGYRVAAEWSPFDSLRFNYAYDNTRIKNTQPYLVWTPVDNLGITPFSPQPAFDGDYPKKTNQPTYLDDFISRSSGHGMTIQLDASDNIMLKSISSFRKASRHGSGTLGDALPVGVSSTGILNTIPREDVDQKQWYQEVQAIGNWDNLDVTIGASYFKEKVVDERRSYLTGFGLNPPALGLRPGVPGCIGLETCFTSHSEQNAQSDSYGVYAQATWKPPVLDERLELTAGIRYSDDKKVARRSYNTPQVAPPITEAMPSGPLPPPSEFSARRWDPAFTVKYNFTDAVNAYFRYATAYRAGGANVRSSAFASYGEEEVTAFEIGVKSRLLDNRLTLNVAAFHNTIKGFQNNISEAPTVNPSLTNTVNSDRDVKVKGIEFEASLRVTDELTFSGNYSYTDAAKYVEYDNPITAAVDLTRFYTFQTPKHQGNVAVDYKSPETRMGKFVLHTDYSFSNHYWTTPGGLLVASLGPTYKRPTTKTNNLNARVGLQDIPLGTAFGEISLFGKNILNDTHYVYGFDGAAFGGGFAEFLVEPFIYGIELRFHY